MKREEKAPGLDSGGSNLAKDLHGATVQATEVRSNALENEKVTGEDRLPHLAVVADTLIRYNCMEDDLFGLVLAKNREECDPPVEKREVLRLFQDGNHRDQLVRLYNQKFGADVNQKHGADDADDDHIPWLDFDAVLNLQPPEWVVNEILPEGLTVVYGKPGQGKTFLCLDLALSVASGVTWHDREVIPGGVVYLAAEGAQGLRNRIASWLAPKEGESELTENLRENLVVIPQPVSLVDKDELGRFRVQLATHTTERHAPRLIVVDTLSRCLAPGDENSSKDMAAFVRALDHLRTQTDHGSILVVHHSTKKGDDARGSSVLRGAAECMIGVTAQSFDSNHHRIIQVRCEKAKDSEGFGDLYFALQPVSGTESCRLTVKDAMTVTENRDGSHYQLLSCLHDSFRPDEGATTSQWLRAAPMSESSFHRVKKWLLDQGYVVGDSDSPRGRHYFLTEKGLRILE